MSVINQALKDLQQRQTGSAPRARSLYQAPTASARNLWLGIIGGVVVGVIASYALITYATAGEPEASDAISQPQAQPTDIATPVMPSVDAQPSVNVPSLAVVSQNESAASEDVNTSHDATAAKITDPASPSLNEAALQNAPSEDQQVAKLHVPARSSSAQATDEPEFSSDLSADSSGAPVQSSQRSQSSDGSQSSGSMQVERVERTANELAEQRLEQAIAAMDNGQGRRAENLLQEALVLRPDFVEARQRLAAYYYGRGFSGEAIRTLQEGLAHSPNNSRLLALIARIYEESDRPDDALRALNRLQAELPEHTDLLVLRAALANDLEQYSAAAEDYRALLGMNSERGLWWLGLGFAEEGRGEHGAAKLAYEQALNDLSLDRESREYARSRMEALSAW